jgi:DNA-binding response OmpR family regulator
MYSKLFVFDDDPEELEIMAIALDKANVENVSYAETREEAMNFLDSASAKGTVPNLIIIDFYLRGMTGLEFLGELRHIKNLVDVPVIIFSSLISKKSEEEIRESGIRFVAKPLIFHEYLELIHELKDKYNLD